MEIQKNRRDNDEFINIDKDHPFIDRDKYLVNKKVRVVEDHPFIDRDNDLVNKTVRVDEDHPFIDIDKDLINQRVRVEIGNSVITLKMGAAEELAGNLERKRKMMKENNIAEVGGLTLKEIDKALLQIYEVFLIFKFFDYELEYPWKFAEHLSELRRELGIYGPFKPRI
ncbi:MAG: hypothetical protein ACP5RP_04260 [Candidatus Micrarchaeia archaeon]